MPSIEIIFNIIVVLILLAYWTVAFIIIYHLSRFGVGVQPKRFVVLFLLGSVVLSLVAIVLYARLNLTDLLSQLTT